MAKLINLIGKRFGRLSPIKVVGKDKWGDYRWLCMCSCGNEKIISGNSLRNGNTKSCGCLNREKIIRINKNKEKVFTKKEINILKKYYQTRGSKHCSKIINRSRESIIIKAGKLGLYSDIRKGDKLKKNIIKKISHNKVLSICNKHGKIAHDYYDNKIHGCVKCRNINMKKRRNIPIYHFASLLRTSIWFAFHKILERNTLKIKGCFKNLDYTKEELYSYLENIRKLQNNKCPHCQIPYNKCKISIDHVIPLITAKTEQEVIDLFDLKNLNLMCKSCNSSKNDTNYSLWVENKHGN